VNISMGTGRKVVVVCSLEISRMVCKNRNCRAIGSFLIMPAAWTSFSAAWNSPSALITFHHAFKDQNPPPMVPNTGSLLGIGGILPPGAPQALGRKCFLLALKLLSS
jgi:hypothetical protein